MYSYKRKGFISSYGPITVEKESRQELLTVGYLTSTAKSREKWTHIGSLHVSQTS